LTNQTIFQDSSHWYEMKARMFSYIPTNSLMKPRECGVPRIKSQNDSINGTSMRREIKQSTRVQQTGWSEINYVLCTRMITRDRD